MKNTYLLSKNWELKQVAPTERISSAEYAENKEDWLSIENMPAQVQDVLLVHKKIPEEFLVGWCENVNWMADYDWVYKTSFIRPETEKGKGARLIFKGLDTVADVYLNGKLICEHDNFYLPDEADVTDILEDENDLIIHFHRIIDVLEEKKKKMKPEWIGHVPDAKMVRKPIHDFDPHNKWGAEYQGAVPYFSAIGVYRDILVEYYEKAEIQKLDVLADATTTKDGLIRLSAQGVSEKNAVLKYNLKDKEGNVVKSEEIPVNPIHGTWNIRKDIYVEAPELWYPIGHGEAYLYTYEVQLIVEDEVADEKVKRIGFKNVVVKAPFEFFINGERIRMWGGSLDPLQGWTHVFLRDRAERMFELLENSHYNLLRIWGEGIPYPDEFYDMCDERGFLVWQEFFMGYGPIAESQEYVEEYIKESTVLVNRLKHHACLMMWCGGNETLLGAQIERRPEFGKEVVEKVYTRVVNEHDPGRYYLPSSPYFGEWANDSRSGDVHTFDRVYYYPFRQYPNFVTENCLTAPTALYSLKKFVKGDLFPEDYTCLVKNDTELIMPRNWITRSSVGSLGQRKSGPYWEFYDADNVEDMIYRFGAAAGKELRICAEQVRRGAKEPTDPSLRAKGYVTCKLLDTWPKIYCSTIDFFLEGYIPYYTILRAFEPVMASFQIEDNIRLWIVNDSAENFKGKITFGAYNLLKGEYFKKETIDVECGVCGAEIVYDCSKWRAIPRECVLFARVEDEEGNFVYQSVDYIDVERQLKFPDSELEVTVKDNYLEIKASKFVRCVEILGKNGDDEMGWLFSDNYFDMMPEETRRIRILGKHESGEISVKGHYCSKAAKVDFTRK